MMMDRILESPVTAQADQTTVQATVMEGINNGVNPQRRVTPDSNSNALKIEL